VRGDAARAGRRDAICTSMISREAHTTLVELSACQDLPVLGARPAGDTAWKCAGFRAPMAAIRSGKAGFFGGIYSHVHRPEVRAPAGPAVRCTCVYTPKIGFHAGSTACVAAMRQIFSPPTAAIQSGKAGFLGGAFTRMYTGRKCEPQLAQRSGVHACTRR
jgi:hypothetical protein